MRRAAATYEDLLRVPPDKVAEIINGELIVSPRPASPHASAGVGLIVDLAPFDQLRRRGPSDPGGWWILYEPELHLGPDVIVPDLAGWRVEHLPTMPKVAFFDLQPDWVCEIVSPSTEQIDRVRKMRVYARENLKHVWLVNPLAQVLEVFRLERERYLQLSTFSGGDAKVRAEPFEQVEMDLTRWWGPPPDR